MRKKAVLVLGVFCALFLVLFSSVSLAQAPPVGASSCVTYAQARANNPSLASKTDSQLRSMGFCSGSGTATTTPTSSTAGQTSAETSKATQKTGVDYSAGDERTAGVEPGQVASVPSAEELTAYYEKLTVPELERQYDIVSDTFLKCSSSSTNSFDACSKSCPYYDYDNPAPSENCHNSCAKKWYARDDSCKQVFEARMDAISAAIQAIHDKESAEDLNKFYENQEGASLGDVDDSALLIGLVAKDFMVEKAGLKRFYSGASDFIPSYSKLDKEAEDNFEKTKPLGKEVVEAKNDYQEALRGKASDEEIDRLNSVYDEKLQRLRERLQNEVLDKDPTNPDALWQLGTLSKWEGSNHESYEYYREALVSAKVRNPFMFDKFANSLKDSGVKMQILQSMEPNTNLINVPTTETSPFLKALDDDVKSLLDEVDQKTRDMAEKVEKISRGMSFSNKLPEKLQELNGFGGVED
jgi:hypothetical protein